MYLESDAAHTGPSALFLPLFLPSEGSKTVPEVVFTLCIPYFGSFLFSYQRSFLALSNRTRRRFYARTGSRFFRTEGRFWPLFGIHWVVFNLNITFCRIWTRTKSRF